MKKSFTLIELLIVMILLGFLVTIISANFFTSLKKGRDARRKSDLEQIKTALELYYEDNRTYPTQIPDNKGFNFGSEFIVNEKIYMKNVPNDPVPGKNYRYESDGTYFKLYTCLENNQQILQYQSTPSNFSCNVFCKDRLNNTIPCIFGISSPNINP